MKFNYYKIINNVSKRTYIGITERSCEKRWNEHINLLNKNKHPNYLLQEDWNKLGSKNFSFVQIDTFDGNLEEGYQHEYDLIQSCKDEKYNIALGGQINPMYSPEIKEKMIKTKQKAVPNIYQLEEIEENVFKIIGIYNSQKEAGRLSVADQGNIQHALTKHTKGCGYYWIDENMLKNFEEDWKPARIKIKPCAELDEQGNIVKVHHNRSLFEREYGMCSGAIKNAINRNGKAQGRKFINISEEEYYKIKPITLIK